MRSMRLLAVAVLAVLLTASLFSTALASPDEIVIEKVTTNGDTTTIFVFDISGPITQTIDLVGDTSVYWSNPDPGEWTVIEEVPDGWVLTNIACSRVTTSTFSFITNGVIIHYEAGDIAACTFTNSPAPSPPAVGGVVMPTNTLALVAPWLAVIGLVGCIGTVAVVARKRGS